MNYNVLSNIVDTLSNPDASPEEVNIILDKINEPRSEEKPSSDKKELTLSNDAISYLYGKYKYGVKALGYKGDKVMPRRVFKIWIEVTKPQSLEEGLNNLEDFFASLVEDLMREETTNQSMEHIDKVDINE